MFVRIEGSAMSHIALKKPALWFVALFATTAILPGQSPDHVYQVVVQVPGKPVGILQTGFRVRGTKGIITALHGVIGSQKISAWNEQQKVFSNLTVRRVDVQNDLALLSNQDLQNAPDVGLESGQNEQVYKGEGLTAWGHPVGIIFNKKPVKVGDPPLELLGNLIPPSSANAFVRRRSPDTNIKIIYLSEGNLVPGHSGAPLLSSANHVVGVVDGGLLGGIAGISWAIPLSAIAWQDIDLAQPRLSELAKLSSSDLFAFDEAPPRYFEGASPCQTKPLDTVPFTCVSGNLLFEFKWAQFNLQNGESIAENEFSFVPLENGFRIVGPFAVQGHLFSNVVFEGRIGLTVTTMDGSAIGTTSVIENAITSSHVFTETVNGRKQSVGPFSFFSVGPLGADDQNATYSFPTYSKLEPVSTNGRIPSNGPIYMLWMVRLGGLCYEPGDIISISIASVDFTVGNP
jgi:hypothetical protein